MLLIQSYFEHHLLPKITFTMREKADADKLFNHTFANDGQLLNKMYTKLEITF